MTNLTLPMSRALASDPWVRAALPLLPGNRASCAPLAWAELLLVVGVAARRIAVTPSWRPVVRHRRPGGAPESLRREWESGPKVWHHQWRGVEVADALEVAASIGVLRGFSQEWAVRSPSVDLARMVLGEASEELVLKLALWMEGVHPSRRWSVLLTLMHEIRPHQVSLLVAARPALVRALVLLPGCPQSFSKVA